MNPIPDKKKKGASWRFLVYLIILLYLVADLYVFSGPVRKKIDAQRSRFENSPDKTQWVALVNQEPITKRQLEVAVVEHLFRRGQNADEVSPKNLRIIRLAVLNDLVNDTVIRQYADGARFKADPEAIEKYIEAFESQFESPEDLKARLEAQKLDSKSLHEHLARVVSRKQWIETRIGNAIRVTDEEAKEWFEKNKDDDPAFKNPERFHARHIFISTVMEKGPGREALIRKVHQHLTKENGDFKAVAAEFSEDERTKNFGGDLKWFTKNRMPSDFMVAISKLNVGEISEPFQTDIGWHIVELLDQKPAEPLDFETLKPQIMAQLESWRREERIEELLMRFRGAARIQMYPESL